MRYELRPATAADYPFLYTLHVATMKPYVTQVWGWDEQAQAEHFRSHFDPNHLRIVVVSGQQIGVLEVEERPSELYLANLHVLPRFQGQGWGTRILGDLLHQATETGVLSRREALPMGLHWRFAAVLIARLTISGRSF